MPGKYRVVAVVETQTKKGEVVLRVPLQDDLPTQKAASAWIDKVMDDHFRMKGLDK